MPFPVMTLTNLTATGDVISGPGCPTLIIKGIPVSCLGDAVAGGVCVGAISVPSAMNKIVKGRPVAGVTSAVAGANPVTGIPVVTVCAVTPNVNVIF